MARSDQDLPAAGLCGSCQARIENLRTLKGSGSDALSEARRLRLLYFVQSLRAALLSMEASASSEGATTSG